MATTGAAVMRTYTEEDLERQLKEAKEELFNLRFQAATGQLESHGRLRTVRRDIARIYTVLRERELGIIGFVETEADDQTEAAESAETESAETESESESAEADTESADDDGETSEEASSEADAKDAK